MSDAGRIDDLVSANHILYREGVVDGFGHVSVRHEKDPERFLLARSIAPASVTAADIMEFDLAGEPLDARGRKPYLERYIHSEIYRAIYAEVNARLQSEAMRLGSVTYLNDAEAAGASRANDAVIDRPWDLWKIKAKGKR
jgi:ribulose-5-phosphate 4-epimerase/fuculose-1-phosphate aldolase